MYSAVSASGAMYLLTIGHNNKASYHPTGKEYTGVKLGQYSSIDVSYVTKSFFTKKQGRGVLFGTICSKYGYHPIRNWRRV